MAKEKRKKKRDRKISRESALLAAIFLVALLVRLFHVYQIRFTPFFNFPVVDSSTYDLTAAGMAAGDWLGSEVYWQAPLYPYFLGFMYRLIGRDLFAVRFIQILLGSASCALLFRLGEGLFDRTVGAVAGFTMALYGTLVFFDSELLAPVLLVFLSLLLLYLMIRPERGPWWWFVPGLTLGVLSIGHGLALAFFPFGLAWVAMRKKGVAPVRGIILSCVLFAVGAGIPIAGVTVRNYVVGDEFVLISSNTGVNFYIGNNPDYDNAVGVRPGLAWERLNREPLDMGLKKHSERSGFFFRKAFASIRNEPTRWGGVLARKLYILLNGNEVGRNQSIYPFRTHSFGLRVLLWKYGLAFPFGLLVPLGIVGIILAWRERLRTGLLALFLLSTVASVLAFFVCARYRITTVPVLIIFSTFSVVWVVRHIKSGKWRASTVPVAGVLAMCVLLNLRTGTMPSDFSAEDYFALASSCGVRGAMAQAEEYYLKALGLRAEYPDVRYNLGNIYRNRGMYDRAIDHYREAIRSEPDFPEALYNMAVAYTAKAEYDSATAEYRKALKLRPHLAEAMIAIGELFLRKGMPDSAAHILEEGLKHAPDNPMAHHDLAIAYYGLGRYNLAFDEISKAKSLGMVPNPKLYLLLKDLVTEE